MKATELKKKYPDFWTTIESAVLEDLLMVNNSQTKEKPFNVHHEHVERIAHNAAFNATYEYHKRIN